MRVYIYIMITVGIMALLNLAGLVTTGGYILGQLGLTTPDSLATFKSSSYYVGVIGFIALLAGISGVVIGTLTRTSYETAITGSFASAILVLFISDIITISQLINSSGDWAWLSWLLYLIMLPFLIGFMHSVYDWVRRHD